MAKKLTQEEYAQRVYERYGNEYTVLGTYTSKTKSIKVQHECGYIFDPIAGGFADGRIHCPMCFKNSTKLNTEIIKKRIQDKYGDEFELLDEYIHSKIPVRILHKKCGHVFPVLMPNFLRSKIGCPKCAKKVLACSQEEFIEKLQKVNNTLVVVGKYINSATPILIRCKKCSRTFKPTPSSVLSRSGCPHCSNQKVSVGLNDMWTTHPEIAKLLKNPEFGYTHTFGTNDKAILICPNCNSEIYTKPKDLYNVQTGCIRCHNCGDGISFPEKIMSNILTQLNIPYIYQYSKKHCVWAQGYRYDFYLPSYNYIIEIHGGQHYENRRDNLEKVKQIDKTKYDLAIQNGVSQYIVIDAMYSDLDYIKESIFQSLLSQFELDKVDWNLCAINSSKSLLIEVCNDWNNGMTNVPLLSEKYKLTTNTIYDYLEKGANFDICTFNKEKYIELIKEEWYGKIASKTGKRIMCVETGEVFTSLRQANQKFVKYGNGTSISRVLDNPNRTAYGYHWISIN